LEITDDAFEEAYLATERAYLAVDEYEKAPEEEKEKYKKLAEQEIEIYKNTKMPDMSKNDNNAICMYL